MGTERDQERTKHDEHLGIQRCFWNFSDVQHNWIRLTNKKFMTVENKLREGKIKTCEDKNKNSGYQRFSWLIDRRKAMTNLDSPLKSRDTALPTKLI